MSDILGSMSKRQARTQPLAKRTMAALPVIRVPGGLRGLLFIGDPHIASYTPGRRLDASYLDTVLGKLAQAGEIAKERRLWPVCPGDLFESRHDTDITMLVRTTRVLRQFWQRMTSTPGNHDKAEMRLSEGEAMSLLAESGTLEVIHESRLWAILELEDESGGHKRLGVGFTPYGHPLPGSLAEVAGLDDDTSPQQALAAIGADAVVWITHADLAFDGVYPGAKELFNIPGIETVINGHMHGQSIPILVGGTAWHNPGNITRMSIDHANDQPGVWAFEPLGGQTMAAHDGSLIPLLEKIALEHKPGEMAFDFAGRRAAATGKTTAQAEQLGSLFVTSLMADESTGGRSADASRMLQSLEQVMVEQGTSSQARLTLMGLAQRTHEAAIKHV